MTIHPSKRQMQVRWLNMGSLVNPQTDSGTRSTSTHGCVTPLLRRGGTRRPFDWRSLSRSIRHKSVGGEIARIPPTSEFAGGCGHFEERRASPRKLALRNALWPNRRRNLTAKFASPRRKNPRPTLRSLRKSEALWPASKTSSGKEQVGCKFRWPIAGNRKPCNAPSL